MRCADLDEYVLLFVGERDSLITKCPSKFSKNERRG